MNGKHLKKYLPKLITGYLNTVDNHIQRLDSEIRASAAAYAELAQSNTLLRAIIGLMLDKRMSDNEVLSLLHDPTLTTVQLDGELLLLHDHGDSLVHGIAEELQGGAFGVLDLTFQAEDVIIIVGANVGVSAIFLAKRWPSARILAIEPNPRSFADLERHIHLNGTPNITAINLAITADGRDCVLRTPHFGHHWSSLWIDDSPDMRRDDLVHSTTLDPIFVDFAIERCGLLIMDCEGCEHEILGQTNALERVDRLAIEAHEYPVLRLAGCSNLGLRNLCETHFPQERLWFSSISADPDIFAGTRVERLPKCLVLLATIHKTGSTSLMRMLDKPPSHQIANFWDTEGRPPLDADVWIIKEHTGQELEVAHLERYPSPVDTVFTTIRPPVYICPSAYFQYNSHPEYRIRGGYFADLKQVLAAPIETLFPISMTSPRKNITFSL